jgi:hypothetical protein
LIAEVQPDFATARAQHQDWRAWLDQDLVDAVAPIDDGRRDPRFFHACTEQWRERTLAGAHILPELRVDASPAAVMDDGAHPLVPVLSGEWSTRLAALRKATGSVLVTRAEPWLRSGLPDVASSGRPGDGGTDEGDAPSRSAREVLAAALARR